MSNTEEDADWFSVASALSIVAATTASATSSSAFNSPLVKTLVICSTRDCFRSDVKREMYRVKEWGEDGLLFRSTDLGFLLQLLQSEIAPLPSCSTLLIACSDHLAGAFIDRKSFVEQLCSVITSFSPNLLHHLLLYHIHLSPLESGLLSEAVLHHQRSLRSLSIFASLCSETFLIPLLTSNSSCTSLTSLSILGSIYTGGGLSVNSHALQRLGTILGQNTISLTSLIISNAAIAEEAILHLFSSLKQNRHLTFLSLSGCTADQYPAGTGKSWPIASILDCLQFNTAICELDLTRTPLQNHPAITAQLLRNKENAERLKLLSRLGRPTTIRLFFCGLQYSGKTTLARSLANWNKNASWLSRAATRTSRLKRTRGIEVTILEKEVGDLHQRILLWDMAGEMEFHSFHDSMFPDLSSRAAPSMFLFVWNPFEIDAKGKIKLDPQGQTRRKDAGEFRGEFKYWLRFIASKTLQSEIFKPKVLVAVTRADLLGSEEIKAWLMPDFTALQEEFTKVVEFDEEGFFHLNAKDHVQAGLLGSHVFDCAQAILKQVPDVYQACAEARELLANMVHGSEIPPLITKDMFHQLCHQKLDMASQEMREAVALTLNDSGDLIYFKSLELVVLDTQWFCHKIMGDLLNDIITKKSFDRSQIGDVFFPVSVIEALLERKVNSRAAVGALINRRSHKKVAGCDLVKLLVGLRLACENNSGIFISISLSGKAKRTLFPRNYLTSDGKSDSYTYLGRRLTCKNFKCTFLTPGLFPLLQVTFHNKLHDREAPILVLLQQDVMAFAFGGVKVLIEFCRLEGKDHFIDILAYSSKSLDGTIEWLQKNVIEDVEKVCAEPRGIQGVELAHAVIQRASIENFSEARERPAVSLKELQEELKNHVEREGVKLADDGIKTVMYTWQTASFPAESVVDLLGEVETARVVQSYWCGLTEAEREISNLFNAEETEITSQPVIKPQFGTSQFSKEIEIVYNKVCEFEMNVMKDLEKLGRGVQDLRNAVLPKLCELFTFVKEGEAGNLPRMFVVTEDDGIVQRVVSAIVPGLQNVRLKLLCECRGDSCHFVDGKRGLSLAALDDGLLKRGLPYINALLKVAYVVARVGAHVAVGCGNQIPDFTQVLASILDSPALDGVPVFTNLTDDFNSSSRVDFTQGQQWLFDVLSNRDCIKGDQIHAVFGLRRVRFPDSRAAWVCDRHYREGTPWPA